MHEQLSGPYGMFLLLLKLPGTELPREAPVLLKAIIWLSDVLFCISKYYTTPAPLVSHLIFLEVFCLSRDRRPMPSTSLLTGAHPPSRHSQTPALTNLLVAGPLVWSHLILSFSIGRQVHTHTNSSSKLLPAQTNLTVLHGEQLQLHSHKKPPKGFNISLWEIRSVGSPHSQ